MYKITIYNKVIISIKEMVSEGAGVSPESPFYFMREKIGFVSMTQNTLNY